MGKDTALMFRLVHQTARERAIQAVKEAPEGVIVQIKPPTRSLDQSAKFHAICGELSRKAKYLGRTLRLDQWKVLLISGHAIATGQQADIIPGLEGEFVNIRESSAQMSVARMNSLLEYALAYCATEGIELDQ